MAMWVQGVVGELELEKGDGLFHPVTSWCRGVWVHVGPTGGLGLRLTSHFPLIFIPLQRGR